MTTPDAAPPAFHLRRGGPADVDVLLGLFDAAVAWLVARGQTGQWGTTPFSADPKRVASCRRWAAENELWVAESEGRPAAAMVLGDALDYVPASDVPEVYVRVLVGAHEPWARGAGSELLRLARRLGVERGVTRLRVDCYAGAGGNLVRYYERQGFTPTGAFEVGEWPGQILELSLSAAAAWP